MAPAVRGEPLDGSEIRLKQLACCRHIVLWRSRGYWEIPECTVENQARAGEGLSPCLAPACAARGGWSGGRCAPPARGPAPRLPSTPAASERAPGPRQPPQARAPARSGRHGDTRGGAGFQGFMAERPSRALAPLPVARGRPCALPSRLAYPACLPRKMRFCPSKHFRK